jgi:hypothetical protein
MKRTLSTLILAGIVVLITGTFCFAEYAAAGVENFPYFHLGCMIVGGMIIVSLKQKYQKIYLGEAVGSFAMYAILVALFTAPRGRGSQEPAQLKKGSADNALHPGAVNKSNSEGIK